MALSAKFVKTQLELFKPLLTGSSLETARRGQDKLGELMAATRRKDVTCEDHAFDMFEGSWLIPKDETREGVILYLHGGGYCCGDLSYAKGFASILAAECGIRVFAAAYRLAPESPFPAALDDALVAYRFLLTRGYSNRQIVLCGESAGGGLIFSLCLKLRALGIPLPCGIVALSPWSDLTASGDSYEINKKNDPSLTKERLDFYASLYTTDRTNPLVSPLFGALAGMPRSLIFVGEDEIMLDDARLLHEKLLSDGSASELVIAPGLWHAYVLYDLKERICDYDRINSFLSETLPRPHKLRWMRLDNAAKIYPAARRRNWSNVFRLSATMSEKVNVDILKSALDVTVRRFPSIAVRLCTGAFWYYLEEISEAPQIIPDKCYPLERMGHADIHKCAFRVLVYENRIATEFFHAITDGNGGLVFLKTLLAEYIEQRYGVSVPASCGVLDRVEEPSEEEMEDSFLKYSGDVSMSRRESTAYHLHGTKEAGGFLNVVTFTADVGEIHAAAGRYGVSITAFLCAVMMQAILEIQEEKVPNVKRRRPVKVLLPVNLRKLFDSRTLRNFVLYITPEISPNMGEYTFEEICKTVHHQMGMELTAKRMGARITTNVKSEKSPILKIMPLFIKNVAMKLVFNAVGERKSCLSLSNLGAVALPDEMKPYISRFDFVLGVQASAPNNCGVISYGDKLVINFIRNTEEPELEAHFHGVMRRLGLRMTVESNAKNRNKKEPSSSRNKTPERSES